MITTLVTAILTYSLPLLLATAILARYLTRNMRAMFGMIDDYLSGITDLLERSNDYHESAVVMLETAKEIQETILTTLEKLNDNESC